MQTVCIFLDFHFLTEIHDSEILEPPAINMSAMDLISGEAELGDESDDESFDEQTGESRQRTNGVNGKGNQFQDSSEEEEDDDDEEAARAVRWISDS